MRWFNLHFAFFRFFWQTWWIRKFCTMNWKFFLGNYHFGYQNKNHLIRLNYTERTMEETYISCTLLATRITNACTWQCSLSVDIAWRLWSHFLAMIMDVYLITIFVNKVIKRGTKGLLVNCSKSPHKTVTSNRDSKYRRRFYNYYTTSPSKSSEVTKYHIRKLLSQIQLLMLKYSSACW